MGMTGLSVRPSVCPSVIALTFERINFFEFCFRTSVYEGPRTSGNKFGPNRSHPLTPGVKGSKILNYNIGQVIHHFEGIIKGYQMVYDSKVLGSPLKGQGGVKGQKILNGKWGIVRKV